MYMWQTKKWMGRPREAVSKYIKTSPTINNSLNGYECLRNKKNYYNYEF
jgi:hypothetical protein